MAQLKPRSQCKQLNRRARIFGSVPKPKLNYHPAVIEAALKIGKAWPSPVGETVCPVCLNATADSKVVQRGLKFEFDCWFCGTVWFRPTGKPRTEADWSWTWT